MELSTLTSLIAKLKTHDELPYLEAKINMNESEKIAQTLSALANSASYLGEEYGYMIWGIQDETWDVVGSSFSMEKAKATTKNGFQKGAMWISNALSNRADYSEYEFTIELQRIYVIRIKNCGALPLRYHEIAYIRKHSSNQKLSDYPEMEQIIRQKSLKDYSAEICQGVDISSLDTEAIRIARAGYEIKHPKSSKKQLSDA